MYEPYLKFLGLGLAGLTAGAHILLGTYDTLSPLLATDLDIAIQATFHACWHFISVFLVVSVWCFAQQTASARFMAQLWIAFGACFFAVGIYSAGLRGLIIVPQWILLTSAGALMLLYMRRSESQAK